MKKLTHNEFLRRIGRKSEEYVFYMDYDGADKKFPVLHKVCGEGYLVSPSSIMNGHKCRYCIGFGQHRTYQIRNRLKDSLGGDYEFIGEYKTNKNKIKLCHIPCGRVYDVLPQTPLSGVGCAKCSGQLQKTNEEVAEEIRELVGNEYDFHGGYVSNKSRMRLVHTECGTYFKATYNNFVTKGSRCPKCKKSLGEEEVKEVLESMSISYEREYPFDKSPRRKFDFFLPEYNACIEYDGEHHYKSIKFYGGDEYLEEVIESDKIKDEMCEELGIPLLRIPYWEFKNTKSLVQKFAEGLEKDGARQQFDRIS